MGETDTQAQLKAMGLIPEDVDSATKAYSATPGWVAGLQGLTSAGMNIAKLGGGFGIPGFSGFRGQG